MPSPLFSSGHLSAGDSLKESSRSCIPFIACQYIVPARSHRAVATRIQLHGAFIPLSETWRILAQALSLRHSASVGRVIIASFRVERQGSGISRCITCILSRMPEFFLVTRMGAGIFCLASRSHLPIIVICTGFFDAVTEWLRWFAAACVEKRDGPDALLSAIEAVIAHKKAPAQAVAA